MSRPDNIGKLLRSTLLGTPKGLTLRQLSDVLEKPSDIVSAALYRTYGCYVKEWVQNETGFKGFVAVWTCVAVPSSAERPVSVTEDRATYLREYREQNETMLKRRRKEAEELRRKAREVNAKMREKHEAEKAAAKARRAAFKEEVARIKAEEKAEAAREKARKKMPALQPAAPAGYQPAKTRWVTPPPWSN